MNEPVREPDDIVFRGRHMMVRYNHVAGGTTDRYDVLDKRGGLLAWLRWYGPWKQYVLKPCEGTGWSRDCLVDIERWLMRLNASANLREAARNA